MSKPLVPITLLKQVADARFAAEGFSFRRRPDPRYVSSGDYSELEIAVNAERRNGHGGDSTFLLSPFLICRMPVVNAEVERMVGGIDWLESGDLSVTVGQPLGAAMPSRLLILSTGGPAHRGWEEVFDELVEASCSYGIPFLRAVGSPEGLCAAYRAGDKRLLLHELQVVRIAAAFVVTGSPLEALGLMEERLGQARNRRVYGPVFDRLRSLNDN